MLSAANCILKAFNNRKYLYFVTLKLDYNSMKEQEKREEEERGRWLISYTCHVWLTCCDVWCIFEFQFDKIYITMQTIIYRNF